MNRLSRSFCSGCGALFRRAAFFLAPAPSDSVGPFADGMQSDGIQSGMKLFPAGGVLNDGTAFFLRYPLCGFFSRGVFKIFPSGAWFDLF